MKRLNLNLKFLSLNLGLALALGACGGDIDDVDQYKYYTQNERLNVATEVGAQIGILIEISDKSYNNEYKVDRTLRHLKRHQKDIKKLNANVAKIIIGSSFSSSTLGDRQVLTVSCNSSGTRILEYIEDSKEAFEKSKDWAELTKFITSVSLRDVYGLDKEDLTDLALKLKFVSEHVDFSTDSNFDVLELSDKNAVLHNGAVINFAASKEDMVHEIRKSINARLSFARLKNERDNLTFSIAYQEGVFTGEELDKATNNMVLILSKADTLNKRVKTLILGKRWDYSLNSSTVLYDYKDVSEKFSTKFASINPSPTPPSLADQREYVLKSLRDAGIFVSEVNLSMPVSKETVSQIRSAAKELASGLEQDLAQKSGLKIITFNKSETKYFISTGALHLDISDDNSREANNAMRTALIRNISKISTNRLDVLSKALKIDFNDNSSSLTMGEANSLDMVSRWLRSNLSQEVSKKRKLTVLSIDDDGSTSLSAGTLSISLSDVSESLLKELLIEAPIEDTPPSNGDTDNNGDS